MTVKQVERCIPTSGLVGFLSSVLAFERRSWPVPPIHTYSAQICGSSKKSHVAHRAPLPQQRVATAQNLAAAYLAALVREGGQIVSRDALVEQRPDLLVYHEYACCAGCHVSTAGAGGTLPQPWCSSGVPGSQERLELSAQHVCRARVGCGASRGLPGLQDARLAKAGTSPQTPHIRAHKRPRLAHQNMQGPAARAARAWGTGKGPSACPKLILAHPALAATCPSATYAGTPDSQAP